MTGYREDCLLVLDAIKDFESVSGKKIKELTAVSAATRIMYNNYYGWFEKVDKGLYRISDNGRNALSDYRETISLLSDRKSSEQGE